MKDMERSKARPISIIVRPTVAAFAVQMELKLRENDHKPHWRESTLDYLEGRLQEEVDELIAELSYAFFDGDSHNVVMEAADVANFAMFIADVAGGLELGVLDETIKLNRNAIQPRLPWTCPKCYRDDIIRTFSYCPNCGRRIEWVDGKRNGAQWVEDSEEAEPVDPFANVTNREGCMGG